MTDQKSPSGYSMSQYLESSTVDHWERARGDPPHARKPAHLHRVGGAHRRRSANRGALVCETLADCAGVIAGATHPCHTHHLQRQSAGEVGRRR